MTFGSYPTRRLHNPTTPNLSIASSPRKPPKATSPQEDKYYHIPNNKYAHSKRTQTQPQASPSKPSEKKNQQRTNHNTNPEKHSSENGISVPIRAFLSAVFCGRSIGIFFPAYGFRDWEHDEDGHEHAEYEDEAGDVEALVAGYEAQFVVDGWVAEGFDVRVGCSVALEIAW